MAFCINAEFILGFYQGHDDGGQAEDYPSMIRLFYAFIAAAHSLTDDGAGLMGSSGNIDGKLGIAEEDAAAIRWLEQNPPDAIDFPERFPEFEADEVVTTFRITGEFAGSQFKKKGKIVSRCFYDRPMSWWWSEAPDEGICKTLKKLASEIPYLGEACSLSVIKVIDDDVIPNSACVRNGNRQGHKYTIPRKGYAEVQQTEYQDYEKKINDHLDNLLGTFGKNKSEEKLSESRGMGSLRQLTVNMNNAYYSPSTNSANALPANAIPWDIGFLLRVKMADSAKAWRPDTAQWTAWAGALHARLVKACRPVKSDPLPLFFGKGNAGGNLSIQVLSRQYKDKLAIDFPGSSDAFLVMFPSYCRDKDRQLLKEILREPIEVNLRHEKITVSLYSQIDLSKLWQKPPVGASRFWMPSPLYIAEVRPPKNKTPRYNALSDAMLLSLGYVFRDCDCFTDQGLDREGLFNEVSNMGAKIIDLEEFDELSLSSFGKEKLLHILRDNSYTLVDGEINHCSLKDYVHHAKKDVRLFAGRRILTLGELAGDCDTLGLAIGQNRHFAGGLLVPVDIEQ